VSATTTTLLDIDPTGFADAFGRRPMSVRHHLAGHPLLTLDAIAELADVLPGKSIERHRADLDLLSPGGAEDIGGRPSDTVRELATGNVWMVMWHLEQIPEYKRLLDDCLDEAERMVADRHGPNVQRYAFLFLSAPGATTPVHFDPEHNFLLQIQGTKEMNVGRFADPGLQQAELDRYFDGGHRNLERMPELEQTFRMPPGEGVYVYPFAPHWVKNGHEPSVSLSITFRTVDSRRAEQVNQLNAHLRRLRLNPTPPGRSPVRDKVKAGVFAASLRVRGRHPFSDHVG
jgi:hypothetical protein